MSRYVGTEGVYTHTVAYEADGECPMCSPGVPFAVDPESTLEQVTSRLLHPSQSTVMNTQSCDGIYI